MCKFIADRHMRDVEMYLALAAKNRQIAAALRDEAIVALRAQQYNAAELLVIRADVRDKEAEVQDIQADIALLKHANELLAD